MLGIIIGVGSVITMLAIGQGSKRSIQAQISEMGSNMIMIHPGGDRRGRCAARRGGHGVAQAQGLGRHSGAGALYQHISPSVNSSGQAIFGANNTPTTVYGISPEYLDIRRYKVEDEGHLLGTGRQDRRQGMSGGQIGRGRAFPDGESPVGKVIRFGKIPLRIVGVLEARVITVWVWTRTT